MENFWTGYKNIHHSGVKHQSSTPTADTVYMIVISLEAASFLSWAIFLTTVIFVHIFVRLQITAQKAQGQACWSKWVGVKFPKVGVLSKHLEDAWISRLRYKYSLCFVGIPIMFACPEAHRGGKPNTMICSVSVILTGHSIDTSNRQYDVYAKTSDAEAYSVENWIIVFVIVEYKMRRTICMGVIDELWEIFDGVYVVEIKTVTEFVSLSSYNTHLPAGNNGKVHGGLSQPSSSPF